MLSRVSRPIIQKRFGAETKYFIQRSAKLGYININTNEWTSITRGLIMGVAFGLSCQVIFGVPEGPYYYDEDQYLPEEFEYQCKPIPRFLFKYWFTSTRVGHWNTFANLKFCDEQNCRNRLIQDVRRLSHQIGSVGLSGGLHGHAKMSGGVWDRHAGVHSTSAQLLNEMIQYADEHDIKRSKDAIISKVIVEKGEGAWRQGVVVEFGEHGQSLRMPAVGVAPSPYEKPGWYEVKEFMDEKE